MFLLKKQFCKKVLYCFGQLGMRLFTEKYHCNLLNKEESFEHTVHSFGIK